MIISLTASADTYITNKYIDSRPSIESNVGKAGTLDLFYLYDEVDITNNVKELSRILIKFDIEQLRILSSSIFDSNNFEARLKLHTITTGNPCPSNFTVSVFPLAIPFEEGMGRDVISFADVGSANFLSASNLITWYTSGCEASGFVGDSNIDYYSNIMLGSSSISLESKQDFILGIEDLDIDVKLIVSSTLSGLLENNGFRISFTGSQENDNVSRFVKRFGSRHVKNEYLSPRLEIKFDDSIVDQRSDLVFDTTGSIYLSSRKSSAPANLTLAGGQQLVGDNCIIVQLSTGSYNSIHTGSQKLLGAPITGMYVLPFSISSNDVGIVSGSLTLAQHIAKSGSITFDETWKSLDGTKIFYTGSITIGSGDASPTITERVRLISRCDGPQEVKWGESFYVKTSFYDIALEEDAVKFSYERQPLKILDAQYRVKDLQTQALIFDFDKNYTRLSLDASGNYVNVNSTPFPKGRPLALEFKVLYAGAERIIADENYVFIVKV